MMRRAVGIRDVARAAGVSVTTVSHVLNDTPNTRTSDETRIRVRTAAAELGYRPNRMARGLRTHASGMLGLLTEEIAATPHAGRIILGAQETASAHNLTLAIINSHVSDETDELRSEVEALIDRHADGIIYATVFHDVVDLPEELNDLPAALIGARDRAGRIPSVIPDERRGAVDLVSHLVDRGHRRIAFANGIEDVPATRGRLEGYLEGLRLAGIERDDSLLDSDESEARGGYAAVRRLLDRPDRPTAVFCYNDRMAMGAYRAAAELGLTVPQDVSIVGFDNQEPIASSVWPALTTVALPHYEMGAWAVETLTQLMGGNGEAALLAGHSVRLHCPIVERDSVAGPRAERSGRSDAQGD
jgi:LacI family transcriptional regulator